MISWQGWIVKWICRVFVKRALANPPASPMIGIRRLRAQLGRYDPFNRRFTRGLDVVPVMGVTSGEWLLPAGTALAAIDRAVLYVHCGAFVACSPLSHRRLTTAIARDAAVPVFAMRYRLAPEHRFPAALDDVIAAFHALRARGIAAERIAILGDSAGGNLALAATLALVRRGERPGAALVYSPWTDLAATGASLVTNAASDDMLVGSGVAKSARTYAPTDADVRDPLASPLYGDLADFPPTLVFASTTEILRDDAERFVVRAVAAGVDARLKLERGMPHVWPIWYDVLPEARRAVRETARFLRDRLGNAAPSGGSRPVAASSAPG